MSSSAFQRPKSESQRGKLSPQLAERSGTSSSAAKTAMCKHLLKSTKTILVYLYPWIATRGFEWVFSGSFFASLAETQDFEDFLMFPPSKPIPLQWPKCWPWGWSPWSARSALDTSRPNIADSNPSCSWASGLEKLLSYSDMALRKLTSAPDSSLPWCDCFTTRSTCHKTPKPSDPSRDGQLRRPATNDAEHSASEFALPWSTAALN